jgi:hypothetical protein
LLKKAFNTYANDTGLNTLEALGYIIRGSGKAIMDNYIIGNIINNMTAVKY